METCKATYRWTREEMLRSVWRHNRTLLRPGIFIGVQILVVLLAAFSILILIATELRTTAAGTAVLLVVFGVYWLFLRRGLNDWWICRGFDKHPSANVLIKWEISTNNVRIHCEGLASSESRWRRFIKVVDVNDGFLFYSDNQDYCWLPFSALEHADAVEQVRQFMSANGVKCVLAAGK